MKKMNLVPQKVILILISVLFGFFLLLPMTTILVKSLNDRNNLTLSWYIVLLNEKIGRAFFNSVQISAVSAMLAVFLAFMTAYAVNYTNLHEIFKKVI